MSMYFMIMSRKSKLNKKFNDNETYVDCLEDVANIQHCRWLKITMKLNWCTNIISIHLGQSFFYNMNL